MKVVVAGATGNVGTSVLEALGADERVDEIVGLARRLPDWTPPRTRWVPRRRQRDDLGRRFAGADAVIHLAWLIQPSRDAARARAGQRRRLAPRVRGRGRGRAPARSCTRPRSASTRPARRTAPVDESWPRDGIAEPRSTRATRRRPSGRSTRSRRAPRAARRAPAARADLQARGRARDPPAVRRPVAAHARCCGPACCRSLPLPRAARVQAVHADDVGEAYRLAALVAATRAAPTTSPPTPSSRPPTLARAARRPPRPVPAKPLRVLADLDLARAAAAHAARLARHGARGPDDGHRAARASSSAGRRRHSAEEALHELLDGDARARGRADAAPGAARGRAAARRARC